MYWIIVLKHNLAKTVDSLMDNIMELFLITSAILSIYVKCYIYYIAHYLNLNNILQYAFVANVWTVILITTRKSYFAKFTKESFRQHKTSIEDQEFTKSDMMNAMRFTLDRRNVISKPDLDRNVRFELSGLAQHINDTLQQHQVAKQWSNEKHVLCEPK